MFIVQISPVCLFIIILIITSEDDLFLHQTHGDDWRKMNGVLVGQFSKTDLCHIADICRKGRTH